MAKKQNTLLSIDPDGEVHTMDAELAASDDILSADIIEGEVSAAVIDETPAYEDDPFNPDSVEAVPEAAEEDVRTAEPSDDETDKFLIGSIRSVKGSTILIEPIFDIDSGIELGDRVELIVPDSISIPADIKKGMLISVNYSEIIMENDIPRITISEILSVNPDDVVNGTQPNMLLIALMVGGAVICVTAAVLSRKKVRRKK